MMGRVKLILYFLLAITGARGIEHDGAIDSDYITLGRPSLKRARGSEPLKSELAQLPKLFHLDDYEKCMGEDGGIYCVGQFQVYSASEDHPKFALIQKYSPERNLYNRSYLYRGYCLPSRCPGGEANITARFEDCVDRWARYYHGLRTRLRTLNYCKESGKPYANTPDTEDLPHRIFLYVVLALLAMNVVGTVYDMNVEQEGKKVGLLRMWSIPRNWRYLHRSPHPSEDHRLESLNGTKFLMTPGPIFCHITIFTCAVYQRNPRFMEKYLQSWAGPFMGGLTTFTQLHMVISIFLTSYMMLNTPNIGWKALPKLIVKRLSRMLPVYLLLVGFAATWWSSLGSGPMWHYLVETESAVCRRKFWLMASFLQNLIDPKHICLVQTWIMAVDMQFFIPVVVLTLIGIKLRRWALSIFFVIFVGTAVVTTYLAFKNNFIPAYMYMKPDDYREFFFSNDSFSGLFMTPLSCMMAAAFALWFSFFHKTLQERGIRLDEHKTLPYIVTYLSLFLMLYGAYYCYRLDKITDPWTVHFMILVERLYLCVTAGTVLLMVINIRSNKDPLIAFYRWSGHRLISRLSLGLMMSHWCVNGYFIGHRHSLVDVSAASLLLDECGVLGISFLLAIPLTVMVDIPMQKTMDKVANLLL